MLHNKIYNIIYTVTLCFKNKKYSACTAQEYGTIIVVF